MKSLLFVQSRAPHGSIAGQEGLDAVLAGSAFTTCRILLIEDGVFQLVRDQQTGALGTKDFSVTYGALADYGVEPVYVSVSHLAARGLTTDDLVIDTVAVDDDQVRRLLADADVILSF